MYLNVLNILAAWAIPAGLTLTWDVFKLMSPWSASLKICGLTLTWDVFKWN